MSNEPVGSKTVKQQRVGTLSADHVAHNPCSYQVGSVWPHENAITAAGRHNHRLDTEASQVARGLLDAAARFDSRRLPERFAGLVADAPNHSASGTSASSR